MTAREAYQDVIEYCDLLMKNYEKKQDTMSQGVKRGIRIVKAGVEQKLGSLPEEEEENVQS